MIWDRTPTKKRILLSLERKKEKGAEKEMSGRGGTGVGEREVGRQGEVKRDKRIGGEGKGYGN